MSTDEGPKQPPDAGESGSVEIDPSASASGSVDVDVAASGAAPAASGDSYQIGPAPVVVDDSERSALARDSNASVPAASRDSERIPPAVSRDSDRIVEATPNIDSEPVPGGGPPTASAVESDHRRSRRISKAVQTRVEHGVERLGSGIGHLGEGVSKLGDVTKKLPLVGTSVGKLGEGITKAGESIHALPSVAKTRRGRLLVRSVIVGFVLVFSWIAVIVAIQLRSHDTPDFRPLAEHILVEVSKGPNAIGDVYEKASPRFQEVYSKERFIDLMLDMTATNGKFVEIKSINTTIVTKGPTGRIGRVDLTAKFERGATRGSVDFHWDRGQWKLLGISVEVPANVPITQAEREKRVAACLDDKGHDNSDLREKCDVRDAAETILEMVRDGKAGEVWDQASEIFKQQETRASFMRLCEDQRNALGNYKRLLTVTEARAIGGVSATFDVVAEFDKSSGVRVVFGFTRPSKFARWQLRSFKVVVPMPRPDEEEAVLAPTIDVNPNEPPLMREVLPELEQKPMSTKPREKTGSGK